MKRPQLAPILLLAGLLTAMLLLPACIPSSLSCDSSAEPTPRPTGPITADFYASPNPQAGKGFVTFYQTCTGDATHFYWDLDGDGQYDDGSGRQVRDYYNNNAYYTIGLRATGPGGEDTIRKVDYLEVYGCAT